MLGVQVTNYLLVGEHTQFAQEKLGTNECVNSLEEASYLSFSLRWRGHGLWEFNPLASTE